MALTDRMVTGGRPPGNRTGAQVSGAPPVRWDCSCGIARPALASSEAAEPRPSILMSSRRLDVICKFVISRYRAVDNILAPAGRHNGEIGQVSIVDTSFYNGVAWRVQFEIGIPVRRPGGKEQDLFACCLQQHLLQAIFAVTSIVLVGMIV